MPGVNLNVSDWFVIFVVGLPTILVMILIAEHTWRNR